MRSPHSHLRSGVLACLICLVVLGAGGTAAAQLASLPEPVNKVLRTKKLPTDSLSVWVQEAQSGRVVMALNPDVARNPASVMKLVTTLAGLELLGPGYIWGTDFFASGPVRSGRLQGDLYIKGYGDPGLHTEKFWRALAELRNRGIETVSGDLVVDQSAFRLPPMDPGAFDGQRFRAYNAIPQALVVNFNATRFDFHPDRDEKVVRVSTDPPNGHLHIINNLKLTNGKCRGKHYRVGMKISVDAARPIVSLSGDYPARCGPHSILRSIEPDERRLFGVFKKLWSGLGGKIEGQVRLGSVPQSARRLSQMSSEPLVSQIRGMNKHSNNIMTRQLFLTLGREQHARPGTVNGARRVVNQWLQAKGATTQGFFIDNGAGLSRNARADMPD